MDPTPSRAVGRAPSAHSSAHSAHYAKSEGSQPATDPALDAGQRPPSPGLGSMHSRQTHTSLAEFDAREAARRRCFLYCAGLSAGLLLLGSLLLYFLFPRPPSVSASTPTFALTGAPTPAAFAATFSMAVQVNNLASWAPWGMVDVSISATNAFSNSPMLSAAAATSITVAARSTRRYLFSVSVSSATATAPGASVALLACAQAILAGAGCASRLTVTGTPTYLGLRFPPRSFDANVVLQS